jgi:hypothetical protein
MLRKWDVQRLDVIDREWEEGEEEDYRRDYGYNRLQPPWLMVQWLLFGAESETSEPPPPSP